MTKSRDSPISGASRRSRRAQSEWNVESHTPPAVVADELLDALPHLLRRLVRERDRQHLPGLGVAVADEVRDPERDDARLARTGARKDQQRPVAVEHGLALFRIQLSRKFMAGVHYSGSRSGCDPDSDPVQVDCAH